MHPVSDFASVNSGHILGIAPNNDAVVTYSEQVVADIKATLNSALCYAEKDSPEVFHINTEPT